MMTISYASITSVLALAGLLLGGPAARAQAPGWQAAAAVATGTGSSSEILHTAADASGNVVVAGEFQGTIALGGTTLSSPGVRTPFVAKWNVAGGTWAWATALLGTDNAFAAGLAVQGTSIYLAGSFKGTATAGGLTFSSPTSYNTYVAKLTDAGAAATWVWAQQAGGTSDDFGNGLAVQGTSVYTVGLAYSTTLTFGSVVVPAGGGSRTFVAKLTDAGPTASYSWALVPGGQSFAWLRTLAVQGTSVYAGGELQGTGTFGPLTLATSSLLDTDVLLAKITDAGTTGTWAWVLRAGGTGNDRAVAVAATAAGVYVAGDTDGATATFGATTLAGAGASDVFVAKLLDAGTTGTWAWAQRAGGPANDVSRGLAVRGASVYVAGEVAGTPATFGSTSLLPAGQSAAFVARLADAGTGASFAWAQVVGSPVFSTAATLASSGTQVFLGGATVGTTAFGSQATTGSPNASYGYLAVVADAAALPTTAAAAAWAGLGLFPNPARGTTTVQLPAGPAAGEATLTLLDNVGRVVRTTTVALAAGNSQADFDVAGLAPGVYALRVAVGERRATARLVAE